VSKNIQGQEL